jgi:hypothetical protein
MHDDSGSRSTSSIEINPVIVLKEKVRTINGDGLSISAAALCLHSHSCLNNQVPF